MEACSAAPTAAGDSQTRPSPSLPASPSRKFISALREKATGVDAGLDRPPTTSQSFRVLAQVNASVPELQREGGEGGQRLRLLFLLLVITPPSSEMLFQLHPRLKSDRRCPPDCPASLNHTLSRTHFQLVPWLTVPRREPFKAAGWRLKKTTKKTAFLKTNLFKNK